jgi:hypothetical protein
MKPYDAIRKKRTFLFILLLSIAIYIGKSSAAELKFQTGFDFNWWKSNVRTKARQIYFPVLIEDQYKNFSYGILTGYAYTHYELNDGEARSLKDPLDTKIIMSYEILDAFPVNTILGLDLSLPTGNSDIENEDLNLLTDLDLFSVNTHGEGFNINPTVSFSQEWGKWVSGIGFGYVWRGEYDYSRETKDYDPGDIFNLTSEIEYDFSPDWRCRFFSHYAYYGEDQIKNQDVYQEGDFFLLGSGLYYNRIEWNVDATIRRIFRSKSQFIENPINQIPSQVTRIHGNEWIVDLSFRYFINDQTTIKSFLEIFWLDRNDYPWNLNYYIDQREKFSLGTNLMRILSPSLEAEFEIEGFFMEDEIAKQDEIAGPQNNKERYDGFSIGAKLLKRF